MAGGPGVKMAIITNALDNVPVDAQLEYARRGRFDPIASFALQGFDPSLLDLRDYFGRTTELREAILRNRVMWAVGGNSFLLRKAMRESGFECILSEALSEGIVYGGRSAGACVAGTSLRAIALMDEPNATASRLRLK
jgi:dipeptidase E